MTEINKGRFTKGDPRTLEAAKKGGINGGKVSPSNFKNNPELAAKAGSKGGKKSKRKSIKETTDNVKQETN